ncbi:MAG: FdhD protein [Gaiellaceae bacterium]|nr:FdhD protein [Gaiellaceae bacterium]
MTGLTGVLLVGGASRRFGRVAGQTLAARAWRLLGDVCDERIAIGKVGDGPARPAALLDDGTTMRAALAGVVAGLQVARTEICLVVPVDVPSLSADTLRALAGSCADAAILDSGPLPGAFRKSALPALEQCLAGGQLRLRDALAELDVVTLPFGELDTPDSYGAATVMSA